MTRNHKISAAYAFLAALILRCTPCSSLSPEEWVRKRHLMERTGPGTGAEGLARGTQRKRHKVMGEGWTRPLPGTTTQLTNVIGSSSFGGEMVEFINGKSKAHVYRAVSEKGANNIAIAKLWCMPDEFDLVDESRGRKYCSLDNARMTIGRMQALQRVTDECGLDDLAPRMWEEHVIAEIPEKGYVIERHGLFQDIAPGVSFWGFTNSAQPETVQSIVSRINSTQVVRAAIYDLLFSMCDRHLGNIFVDEYSNIKLIDNDQAFGISDERHEMCSLSSVFLPTTQCHAIAALGKDYAKRRRTLNPPEPPNPGVTLDYRCHAPGGKIGRNYPSSVAKCVQKFSKMSAEAIKVEYGFPTLLAAYHLKVRAWTMTHLGFEFALYHGAPQNPHCQVFPKGPPCCRMSAIHGPSNGLGASAAYGSANTVVEGTEEDDRLPAFQCEAPSGWKPNLAVPAPCQAEVQLGEDLSYAGERQHCRACHVWEDGWKIAVESSPAFSSRVPDHAWEEWEDYKDIIHSQQL